MEFAVRDAVHNVGALLFEQILNAEDERESAPVFCPLGHRLHVHQIRTKQLLTILGRVHIRRRYYYDEHCHQGRCRKDEYLDIAGTSFSPGIRRMVARVGASRAFGDGVADLHELSGVSVSTKEIERLAEAVGKDAESFMWRDQPAEELTEGLTVYVEMDGTGVPVVSKETEGHQGKHPEKPAMTREAKLGSVFTQTTVNEKGEAVRDERTTTYVGAITTAEKFGEMIETEAYRRGIEGASRTVILGDGALWIWNLAADRFPKAIQIVDLYHACEHCWDIAKLFYANDEVNQTRWAEGRCDDLEKGDVASVVEALQRLNPRTEEEEKTRDREIGYYLKNASRMRYNVFREKGLFVGSGVCEAGCKTVIGRRLKQSGMYWTVRGANSIIALRCCLLSNQWEEFWEYRAELRAAA